eukprot:scaffold65680_cov27-Attheya_sp.AAC.1
MEEQNEARKEEPSLEDEEENEKAESFEPHEDLMFSNECYQNTFDAVQSMLETERNLYFKQIDYVRSIQIDGVNHHLRDKVAPWIFQVVDFYGVSRECAVLAMSILDRFLQMESVDCRTFILVSTCSLFIATKHLERRHIALSEMLILTGNTAEFSKHELERIEWHILNTISWMLHPPMPFNCVRSFLYLLANGEFRPSIIAMASLIAALDQDTNDHITGMQRKEWLKLLQTNIGWSAMDYADIRLCKAELIFQVKEITKDDVEIEREIWNNKEANKYSRTPLSAEGFFKLKEKMEMRNVCITPKHDSSPKNEGCHTDSN